ncbi:hypothetical protein Hanom_Chr17g01569651 [Helianthus anomalus]
MGKKVTIVFGNGIQSERLKNDIVAKLIHINNQFTTSTKPTNLTLTKTSLRYSTQHNPKAPSPPTTGTATAATPPAQPDNIRHPTRTLNPRRRKTNICFTTLASAAFCKCGAGLDGQCGHLLGLKWVLQPFEGKGKVKVPGLKLLMVFDGGNDVVEVHFVGVAYED